MLNRNKKIGIITYHSAYNFGSALQAYATQKAIGKLGYENEIVNYRMNEQKEFYQKLCRTKYGVKIFLKDIMQFKAFPEKKKRAEAFENFFAKYMKLSKEVIEPEEACNVLEEYAIAVSGSDQIWNKHSCELENNDWKYMYPYLLAGYTGKKISYASSIANMSDVELETIAPYIQKFNYVSVREHSNAEKMRGVFKRDVAAVLDPTFLLNREEWIEELGLVEERTEKYILYYSLGSIKVQLSRVEMLRELANREQCKVFIVTPFAYVREDSVFENHPEYGPIEFMKALLNAHMVVTDSYHGTILSVNLGKDIYSLCNKGGSEFRKTDVLCRIGLEDRIIFDHSEIFERRYGANNSSINYESVWNRVSELRQKSLCYLKDALES